MPWNYEHSHDTEQVADIWSSTLMTVPGLLEQFSARGGFYSVPAPGPAPNLTLLALNTNLW